LNFPKVTYACGKTVGKIGDTGKQLHCLKLLESASVSGNGTDNRQLTTDNRQPAISLNFPKVTYPCGKAVGKIGDNGKQLHFLKLLESASVSGTGNRASTPLSHRNRQLTTDN
jgi:hypothetical protein